MLPELFVPPPLLTAELPGIGGRIKTQPEDFEVEELPAYEGPSPTEPTAPVSASDALNAPPVNQRASVIVPEPMEPPPGYEEVQQQSVAQELEERLRRAS